MFVRVGVRRIVVVVVVVERDGGVLDGAAVSVGGRFVDGRRVGERPVVDDADRSVRRRIHFQRMRHGLTRLPPVAGTGTGYMVKRFLLLVNYC